MPRPKPPASTEEPRFEDLISAIASPDRWNIFLELAKGEPLPTGELARRVGMTQNAASKLVLRMQRAGLLERRFGNVYRISQKFLVPGEAKLDFGPIVARLDYLQKKPAQESRR
jgi:DNA-binding IclR family transcriptional regulator